MSPRVTAITPPADWPELMTRVEVAILLGRSPRSMANDVAARRVWPPPVIDEAGYVKPYRWRKDVIVRYVAGALPRERRRSLARRVA
jgi:hypothetical protein